MTMRTNLGWLVLAFMTAATAAAQTYSANAFSLTGGPGVGVGQFTNGNGDQARFDTVDSEIDSWWGLGIKSQCCNSYSGYGIVFDARAGSMYTQGKVGVGTATPALPLTAAGVPGFAAVAGSASPRPGSLRLMTNTTNSSVMEMGLLDTAPFGGWIQASNGGTNGAYPIALNPSGGNVGIGTSSPGATLEVNGNVKLTSGSGSSMTYPDGTVQSTAWNGTTCGGDYAESVDIVGDRKHYEPGDILVIDRTSPAKFVHSTTPYSRLVAGIYSTKPGLTGRRQGVTVTGEEVPMAMLGIVPTKVSTENGAIEAGDLLVSSATEGYAMKGTDSSKLTGAIIGKAMGTLDSGKGVIEVLVSLQ